MAKSDKANNEEVQDQQTDIQNNDKDVDQAEQPERPERIVESKLIHTVSGKSFDMVNMKESSFKQFLDQFELLPLAGRNITIQNRKSGDFTTIPPEVSRGCTLEWAIHEQQ